MQWDQFLDKLEKLDELYELIFQSSLRESGNHRESHVVHGGKSEHPLNPTWFRENGDG